MEDGCIQILFDFVNLCMVVELFCVKLSYSALDFRELAADPARNT